MKKVIVLLIVLTCAIEVSNINAQQPSLRACSMETMANLYKFMLDSAKVNNTGDRFYLYSEVIKGVRITYDITYRNGEINFGNNPEGGPTREHPGFHIVIDSHGQIIWAYNMIGGNLSKCVDTSNKYNIAGVELSRATEEDIQEYKNQVMIFCKHVGIAYQ